MNIRTVGKMVCAIVVWAAMAMPAAAQLVTGAVTGTVKDQQGGTVPGVTIVLVDEGRGTTLSPTVTNTKGDFVLTNIPTGTYTLRVTMDGFKTLNRKGITVSAGDRVGLGALTIDVGALTEAVTVSAETPLVQSQSGERSFAVTTQSVENLPIANRSFTSLASLAPGVTTATQPGRIGDRASTGGSSNNVMMDGVSTMDTGSNSPLLQMNVESIAEVKVLVSGYQAEYGRSSGIQVSAITKSGTNKFKGSLYGVKRNSDWNKNSQTNILNGDPKGALNEKDLGYSIGGPIGKPGGSNKLFFFYAHEYSPRTGGGDVQRFRFPTALERAGDFSQTYDNNGTLYPYIKDPLLSGTCSAANTTACFKANGVLGQIPANRLYGLGLNILKAYPMPNINGTGLQYNYEITRPEESQISNQPSVRLDYSATQKLRLTARYSGWSQKDQAILGTIPGWNDTRQYNPFVRTLSTTVNYTLTNSMFLEATYGFSQNSLTGCALAQANTGPTFCRAAFPTNEIASLSGAGLTGLPSLFPNAGVIDPSYFAYEALNGVKPSIWDGTRISMLPNFAWGTRIANAPPNMPFPGYLNINRTQDVSISVTKVVGQHNLKAGFYNTHSFKAQQRQGWAGTITFSNDTSNPLDTSFGYANAALGVFSSYNQLSRYVEGTYVYDNREGFVQDNWKITNKLTLDYGLRFVNQQPQYDSQGQASNFLPETWTLGAAPVLYTAGCAATPCTGNNRQALDPRTNTLLGPNTALAIGTLIPGSGNASNGLFLSGQGIADTTYTWPALRVAPRFGFAYDVTGKQNVVVRGGAGLFFDRPSGNAIYAQVQNPPTIRNLTVRYATLQSLATGLTTEAAPSLSVYEYSSGLPSTWQWNGGVQTVLPWSAVLDVTYTGQHGYNLVEGVNINAVDFGAAFAAKNQDSTISSTTPGAATVAADQMRGYRGFSTITLNNSRGWVTTHILALSVNRRFANGVSFLANDTIVLAQKGSVGARLQHIPDGSYTERADQAQANELLGNFIPTRHTLKASFVWAPPHITAGGTVTKVLGWVLNDWQLSGVWTGTTGAAYTVGASYQGGATGNGNQNITGSPDYAGRVNIVGNTGSGCSSDQYAQFNTAAFSGPTVGSVGLESGADYLRGCFLSQLDLSLVRNIKFGGNRNLQFRLDMFNAPNQAIVTGRNTAMQLTSPTVGTQTNLPYDASGALITTRSLPKNAGFGVASAYQAPRTLQAQLRFSF